MGATLPPAPRREHYAHPDGVTRQLALALGKTPGGVHQLLDGPDGLWARVERILAIACARGHTAWAAARVERLSRLVRQARVALTPDLVGRAQAADLAEDLSETRYLAAPTVERLEEWLRTQDRAVLEAVALRDAIAGELERLRA